MRFFIIIIIIISMQKKEINVRSQIDKIPVLYAHFQQKMIKIALKVWKHGNFILKTIFKYLNDGIQITLFLIILLQTIHVVSNRNVKQVNIRHLLVKWIFFILILALSKYIKQHTKLDELFRFMCNMMAFTVVYPSKFLKELHLKYFAYKDNNADGQMTHDEMLSQKTSIPEKLMASFIWILLRIIKFIIVFVPLTQRRYIEDELRHINTLIVQQKQFWKIFQTQKYSTTHLDQLRLDKSSTLIQTPPNSPLKNSLGVKELKKTDLKKNDVRKSDLKKSDYIKKSDLHNTIVKVQAQQHIQMNLPTFYVQAGFNKKYVFYRNIDIEYNLITALLKISSIDEDGKIDYYNLVEILLIDDFIIQFQCEGQDELISVKFKSIQEKQDFITRINTQT